MVHQEACADEDGIVRIPTVTEKDSGSSMEEDPERCWCYCGQPSYGQMIMCEHKDSTFVLFHFDCLRIRCPPKTKMVFSVMPKTPKVNKYIC